MENTLYICVDVEASGPNPHDYAMISIGAASVRRPRQSFYAELKPSNMAESAEAAAVHGLSLKELAENGEEPKAALERLEKWLVGLQEGDEEIVFVAFNASFDWMFVNDYFMRYLGRNPFGHRALDMKALYMGMRGVPWAATTHRAISADFDMFDALPHHAEQDALLEAELFERMLQDLTLKIPDMTKERKP